MHGVRHGGYVAGTACALLASGAAALVTRAGLGQHASALWMSALTLATMMIVPTLTARSSVRRSSLPTAATLIVTMIAMSVVPPYLTGSGHGGALASLIMAMGITLLFYWLRLIGRANEPLNDSKRTEDESPKALHAPGTATLLALLAGVSSGSLARFQLYAICGVGGTQPIWQGMLSVIAVCVLALAADRSSQHRMLTALYMIRAALIGALAAADTPALAPLAAKIFLVLDCLTIPALMNVGGKSSSVFSAGCSGAAHHMGMVLGAALSTTPYFFGDGFIVLYALSAVVNMLCAATLTKKGRSKGTNQQHRNVDHRQADRSAEHGVRSGKNDCLVTDAECARTQIPLAPLPQLREGPA